MKNPYIVVAEEYARHAVDTLAAIETEPKSVEKLADAWQALSDAQLAIDACVVALGDIDNEDEA